MKKSGVSAILFDLDGTLVDSLAGIEASIHWAAQQIFPVCDLPDVRDSIGPPVEVMLARLWPAMSESDLMRMTAAFRKHYDTEGCSLTRLFPGVEETLAKFERTGVVMFVLTNKPARPTRAILEQTGIGRRFRALVSPDSSTPPFSSKSAAALELQLHHELAAGSTLVVGDGVDDAAAAAACDFEFVLAGYGYGNAVGQNDLSPIATLETFSDLERIVL